jgi:hypothetical protein
MTDAVAIMTGATQTEMAAVEAALPSSERRTPREPGSAE